MTYFHITPIREAFEKMDHFVKLRNVFLSILSTEEHFIWWLFFNPGQGKMLYIGQTRQLGKDFPYPLSSSDA